jgi:DNA invertase Pin-like site-specific DNA recombinase
MQHRNLYREKVTGAQADGQELLRMLDRLVPGDVVTVTRIDRLALNSEPWPSRRSTPAPAPGV